MGNGQHRTKGDPKHNSVSFHVLSEVFGVSVSDPFFTVQCLVVVAAAGWLATHGVPEKLACTLGLELL